MPPKAVAHPNGLVIASELVRFRTSTHLHTRPTRISNHLITTFRAFNSHPQLFSLPASLLEDVLIAKKGRVQTAQNAQTLDSSAAKYLAGSRTRPAQASQKPILAWDKNTAVKKSSPTIRSDENFADGSPSLGERGRPYRENSLGSAEMPDSTRFELIRFQGTKGSNTKKAAISAATLRKISSRVPIRSATPASKPRGHHEPQLSHSRSTISQVPHDLGKERAFENGTAKNEVNAISPKKDSEVDLVRIKSELSAVRLLLERLENALSLRDQQSIPSFSNLNHTQHEQDSNHTNVRRVLNQQDIKHELGNIEDPQKTIAELARPTEIEQPVEASFRTIHDAVANSKIFDDSQKGQVAGIIDQIQTAFETPHNESKALLKDLFPEEVLAAKLQRGRSPLPRLQLADVSRTPGNDRITRAQQRNFTQAEKRKGQKDAQFGRMGQSSTILTLLNASRHLHASDFARLQPKGKHIADWDSSEPFFRVIAARNHARERNGRHFLIFPSPAAARAYQENVARIHNIVKAQTPTGLTSPLTPPPGYLIDGEDVHATMQGYAILPPSQSLTMQVRMPPLSQSLQSVVRAGGFSQLVPEPERKVIFWVEGSPQPTPSEIIQMCNIDGRRRGFPWNIVGVTKLQTPDTVMVHDAGNDKIMQKGEQRWVIQFQDERMPVRFWRRWHRAEWGAESVEVGEVPPTANVDMV